MKDNKKIEKFLIGTKEITSNKYEHKYLVFDVETNGVKEDQHDLLSLSIYNPFTGICYNRYFPLDLQTEVVTSYVNGITNDLLINATHIT